MVRIRGVEFGLRRAGALWGLTRAPQGPGLRKSFYRNGPRPARRP
jgi:hypothetical protein